MYKNGAVHGDIIRQDVLERLAIGSGRRKPCQINDSPQFFNADGMLLVESPV
jgi:hypothetical protein